MRFGNPERAAVITTDRQVRMIMNELSKQGCRKDTDDVKVLNNQDFAPHRLGDLHAQDENH